MKIRPSKAFLYFHDLYQDVSTELRSQVMRTVLLISAVALSIGALLASVGISRNAAYQIDADLAASTLNLVSVQVSDAARQGQETQNTQANSLNSSQGSAPQKRFFAKNTLENLYNLGIVDTAGYNLDISSVAQLHLSRNATQADFSPNSSNSPSVLGASSGFLATRDIPTIGASPTLLDTQLPIAFLGKQAADKLGIPANTDTTGLTFEINGTQYSVAGFLGNQSTITNAIVIPYEKSVELAGSDLETKILIKASLGAGTQVAHSAILAIKPEAPEKLEVSQVVSADKARFGVSDQLTKQATWVGIFLILLSTLLIANSMVVSVTSRTTEIGVRRALGSSKSQVAAVFWFEGAALGFLGGLAGGAVASWVMVIVAWVGGWTALISANWIAIGPLLGTGVGILASAYPAIRAAKIHPAIAVRAN
ncbi:ABC transporter permease [Arcanobacterium canis]